MEKGWPLGDTEGLTLDDLKRKSPGSPPSGPDLQTSRQFSRSGPAAEGPRGPSPARSPQVGEGSSLSLPTTPPLPHQHLCFQSVLSSNGTVYTVTSDTSFHLLCHAVSLRTIAVNTVYTPRIHSHQSIPVGTSLNHLVPGVNWSPVYKAESGLLLTSLHLRSRFSPVGK